MNFVTTIRTSGNTFFLRTMFVPLEKDWVEPVNFIKDKEIPRGAFLTSNTKTNANIQFSNSHSECSCNLPS